MALENVSDEQAQQAASQVEEFLSRSIPIKDVEPVTADFVADRTGARGLEEELPEYSIYLRVKTGSMDRFDVLESRGEVFGYLEDTLEMMEMNGEGPDSILMGTDHPPSHITKPLVFFVEATI